MITVVKSLHVQNDRDRFIVDVGTSVVPLLNGAMLEGHWYISGIEDAEGLVVTITDKYRFAYRDIPLRNILFIRRASLTEEIMLSFKGD